MFASFYQIRVCSVHPITTKHCEKSIQRQFVIPNVDTSPPTPWHVEEVIHQTKIQRDPYLPPSAGVPRGTDGYCYMWAGKGAVKASTGQATDWSVMKDGKSWTCFGVHIFVHCVCLCVYYMYIYIILVIEFMYVCMYVCMYRLIPKYNYSLHK